jgi:pyruvate dehydrogenase E1 component alpha subunit
MPSERADGTDVLVVREVTRQAVERARSERVPSLLEFVSPRLRGHSVVDPDRYRPESVLSRVRAADPLPRFAAALREIGLLDDAARERIEREVEAEVQRAVEFADSSPAPDPGKLFEFSYATPVANEPRFLPGERPW